MKSWAITFAEGEGNICEDTGDKGGASMAVFIISAIRVIKYLNKLHK